MEPLLTENEWFRNVGTENYPVSFLHEYAVGLIWDLLHTTEGPVELPTLEGPASGNVLADTDKVILPDALQSTAGYIPDISLLKDSRPVRCIEVVVTTSPPANKLAAIRNLGVEVVQVPVRNDMEFRAICRPVESEKAQWWPKFSTIDYRSTYRSVAENRRWEALRSPGGKRAMNDSVQAQANKAVCELLISLSQCSPELRRVFVAQLNEISELDSLYPLRQNNPKYSTIYPTHDDANNRGAS